MNDAPDRRRLPQDSVLWRLDALAAAVTMVLIALTIWLAIVLTWIAALVTGAVVVALIAGLAYGYLYFRMAVSMLEDRLRGRGQHRFDVFISYRHREHREIVDAVHGTLQRQGLRVWTDKHGGVPRSSWGLLLPLLRGLRYSRSVVFLVPTDAQVSVLGREPLTDRLKRLCVQPLESAVAGWHREFYGVKLVKHPSESWQQWERRIALETRIPLFWSVTVDRGRIVPGDLERVSASIQMDSLDRSMTRHAALAVRPGHLDEDIGAAVGRGLHDVRRPGREIPMAKREARRFVGAFALIVLAICVLGIFALLSAALDAVKRVLAWPFRQSWVLISRAWAWLSRRGGASASPPAH